jgi:hypothetical protein
LYGGLDSLERERGEKNMGFPQKNELPPKNKIKE